MHVNILHIIRYRHVCQWMSPLLAVTLMKLRSTRIFMISFFELQSFNYYLPCLKFAFQVLPENVIASSCRNLFP
jgi:hypothetical protein